MIRKNAGTMIASVALAAMCSSALLTSTIAPATRDAVFAAATAVPVGRAVA